MRPIKFRAWDEAHGMIQVTLIDLESFEVQGEGGYRGWDKPLMQFTGLLDKNGKEIYESDIVRSLDNEYDHSSFEIRSQVVQFNEGSFLPVSERHASCFEVIGNIYENPDLLT